MGTPRSASWGAVLLFATLLLSAAAARADYEKGRAAWDAVRHFEAVKESRAAVRANDARAMRMAGKQATSPPKAVAPPASASAADCKWGKRSIRAYRDFLREANMSPSDVLSPGAMCAMHRLTQDGKLAAKPVLKPALQGKADVYARDGRGWTP